jgi:hypothetical protein
MRDSIVRISFSNPFVTPQQIDLTRTFKGQGLYGSWEAFVKRKNEGTLVPHIQKLFADKERFSLTDIRKLIHTECVKEKVDSVVVLKEGSCRQCEEEGIPLPRARYARRRSSSYYLEDWIQQYLSTVNKRQKRLRVSNDEYDYGYVPSGTQSRDYDYTHSHEGYPVHPPRGFYEESKNLAPVGNPSAYKIVSQQATRTLQLIRRSRLPRSLIMRLMINDRLDSPALITMGVEQWR